jgi:hypothetical protein
LPSVPQQSRQKVCWRWSLLQANTPARALDAQRGRKQPTTQQEHSVIGQTDLETDRADVELVTEPSKL